MTLSWQGTEDLPWIPMFLLNKTESNLQLCELDQPQNRAIWPSGKKQVALLPWLLQTIEMWYLYFMNRSVVNLDMIIICSSTLVSILDNYTCQMSGMIACGSKTSISHLLTPVVQFLMPGRKVWAITALTDTFWKQYINNLKKLEAMREKKSPGKW